MYLDAKPIIRYPIAAALAVAGGVAFHFFPNVDPIVILLYGLLLCCYARELALGIMWMAIILITFKQLVQLHPAAAIFLAVFVLLFFGF